MKSEKCHYKIIVYWQKHTYIYKHVCSAVPSIGRKERELGLQTKFFNLCFCLKNICFRPVCSTSQGFKHFFHSFFLTSAALLREIVHQVLLQEDFLHVLHHLNLCKDDRHLGLENCSPGSTVGRWSLSAESTCLCFFWWQKIRRKCL